MASSDSDPHPSCGPVGTSNRGFRLQPASSNRGFRLQPEERRQPPNFRLKAEATSAPH
jgi:hypothetical protein